MIIIWGYDISIHAKQLCYYEMFIIFGQWIIWIKTHKIYIEEIWSAPNHYLNQWWNVVNWTLTNKLQLNFNRNSYILIQ